MAEPALLVFCDYIQHVKRKDRQGKFPCGRTAVHVIPMKRGGPVKKCCELHRCKTCPPGAPPQMPTNKGKQCETCRLRKRAQRIAGGAPLVMTAAVDPRKRCGYGVHSKTGQCPALAVTGTLWNQHFCEAHRCHRCGRRQRVWGHGQWCKGCWREERHAQTSDEDVID